MGLSSSFAKVSSKQENGLLPFLLRASPDLGLRGVTISSVKKSQGKLNPRKEIIATQIIYYRNLVLLDGGSGYVLRTH